MSNVTGPRKELDLDFYVFYPSEHVQSARSGTLPGELVEKILSLKHDS
jgi:hypothetical protein